MFIKNIYHVWLQGCENITEEKFILNTKMWKVVNPDWNYFCIGENELSLACEAFSPECKQAFDKTTNMHTKIDLGRLVVLYMNGGMNVDMDMYPMRPVEYSEQIQEFLKVADSGMHAVGVSVSPLNLIEKLAVHQSFKEMFNNAFLISTKANPVLKDVINVFVENILKLHETGGGHIYVHKTTGPMMFSKNFTKFSDKYKDTVALFPFDYTVFEPCDISGKCDVTGQTISIHNFELSWLSNTTKSFAKFYISNKIVVYVMLLFIIAYVFKSMVGLRNKIK